MKRLFLLAAMTTAACSALPALVSVSETVAHSGQLFCQAAGTLYQAGVVKVTGATAETVAAACNLLQAGNQAVQGAVPVPATAGQTAVVATVPQAAADAVAQSVTP